MNFRRVIKTKNGENSYQSWAEKQPTLWSEDVHPTEEQLKAEPDLYAVEEIQPGKLEAAISAIQDGALKKLSPTQQKIFQMSVVEGQRDREIMATLQIDKAALKYHFKEIGFKLRRATEKKMKEL